jgi:hypothetical protein
MANDKSIIYYSASSENFEFEQKIIDDLKQKAGDIQIISVTRKPLDLGTNICVGEIPISYTSEWMQLLIGLKAAKTKFCIAAESDCIYPEEYFTFTPPEERMMYNYNNIWMVWKRHNGFWQKTGYCEGAQMCGREYWIERLAPLLPEKWEPYTREQENELVKKIFSERKEFTGNPVISFKTGNGVSKRTTFKNKKVLNIDYWGDIAPLKKKYFG